MTVQLEPGLILTDIQLPCLEAIFIRDGFVDSEDNRGQAYLFERLAKPAVFIEVIHTLPDKMRGNHVHQNCDETLHVVSGSIALYLLCNCSKKHALKRIMKKGEGVITPKGTPHALQTLEETEMVILFDKDPREDRERVQILAF